jgi:tetratricopeptide (TPR) repeat protein
MTQVNTHIEKNADFNPFEYHPGDEEQFKSLITHIELSETFNLIFAVCNSNSKRQKIINRVRNTISDKKIEELYIEESTENLYHIIKKKYSQKESQNHILMIYGLERWLPSGFDGENSAFVQNLNVTRDHFPYIYNGVMVLWLSEHHLDAIARGAPDFCSVRSCILTFSAEKSEHLITEGIVQSIGHDGILGLKKEERIQRVKNLENLIEDIQKEPEEKRDLKRESRLVKAAAETWYVLAEYEKAEKLLKHALKIDTELYGDNHPNIAGILNYFTVLLISTNHFSEAEPLIKKALKIDEEYFGKDHPNVARDLTNLAMLLDNLNRLSEAESLIRRALKIDEEYFGKDHPKIAIVLNNLAILLRKKNRLSEAEPLMRKSLKIDEESFGSVHPNVATQLNNLAVLLKETNRISEAEPLIRRALKIDENAFGTDHPNVARDLNNLIQLLQDTNRLSEAKNLMQRSLDILEKNLGPEHPNTMRVRQNLETLMKELEKKKLKPAHFSH